MKLTIIGAGNIGSAIACGLGGSRLVQELDICCADPVAEKLHQIKKSFEVIQVTTDNLAAIEGASVVILAVKPWLIESVIEEIRPSLDCENQMIISVAAGINFLQLRSFLNKEAANRPALFRVIPNTAIAVKESANFVAASNASQTQIDVVLQLFNELGQTIQVEERLIPACTALASCGIAFAFRYIRAAVEGAVELGIHPELAKKIELQTLRGAVALLEANNSHPEAEIDKVTTPGGITIKGLNAMEEAGFSNAVIKGLKASV